MYNSPFVRQAPFSGTLVRELTSDQIYSAVQVPDAVIVFIQQCWELLCRFHNTFACPTEFQLSQHATVPDLGAEALLYIQRRPVVESTKPSPKSLPSHSDLAGGI